MSDFKTIILKHSSVPGNVPQSTDLEVGEMAINLTDKKLFTKDGTGSVVKLGVTEEELNAVVTDLEQAFTDAINSL
jgi:hypothetical protein